jgi:dethiobiotin synthetase
MRKIFVAGIGTDVGKTLVSAILTEALKADYWKPVQTGSILSSDSNTVKNLISNNKSVFHPEAYMLHRYMSPHAAAESEGVNIDLDHINLPETTNTLVIEPAGGLMVPLNNKDLMIDLIKKFDAEVVLVSQIYIGSINHSLLSIEALRSRGIKILGIIFNGAPNELTERVTLEYSGLENLGRIDKEPEINRETVKKYASRFENI